MVKRWEWPLSAMNRHLWAFFYFCRRHGDRCWVTRERVVVEVDE